MRGCLVVVVVYAVGLLISPPDPNLRIVSEHKPVRAWLHGLAIDSHVPADQTVDDAVRKIADARTLEHDAVLDLRIRDLDVVHDRRERPDVRVHDARVVAD